MMAAPHIRRDRTEMAPLHAETLRGHVWHLRELIRVGRCDPIRGYSLLGILRARLARREAVEEEERLEQEAREEEEAFNLNEEEEE